MNVAEAHTEKQQRQRSCRPHAARPSLRRGASLVEVLVVIVIILIGVFSVIRIFPIGFAGMSRAAQRTFAQRLASQQVEQLGSDVTLLPRGVLGPVTFNSQGVKVIDTTLDPDDMGPLNVPGPYPYFSDVNKFRRIEGEAVRVPSPSESGSLYALKFGPMYIEPAVAANPDSPQTSQFLNVYGAPMRGIPMEAEESNSFAVRGYLRTPATYLIDYGGDSAGALIMFPPANNTRRYRISLSTTGSSDPADPDAAPGTNAVAAFEMTVAPAQSATWLPIRDDASGNTFNEVIEGSEAVSRAFNRLAVSGTGSEFSPDDPYEYKLVSANIPSNTTGQDVYANVGILAFNPIGATVTERTAFGEQPFTAYIDYNVLDWHILREDREVPSTFFNPGDAIPIKLTLGGIKRYNLSNELRFGLANESDPSRLLVRSYRGLYGGYARSTADIQVFDLQGSSAGYQDPNRPAGTYDLGEPLVGGDYNKRGAGEADENADYWLSFEGQTGSFRTGTIYVNPRRVPPGSQLRVLYKAAGDWAVAVQKAYERYEPALIDGDNNAATPPSIAPRPTGFDSFGRPFAAGENTRLYFNRSDLNKSVIVAFDYIRNDNTTGGVDTRVRTQPVLLTINRADGDYAYVDLAEEQHKVIPPTSAQNDRRYAMAGLKDLNSWGVAGHVTGASVKVRVIYRDTGTRAPRDLEEMSRQWRIQDIDTFVSRP